VVAQNIAGNSVYTSVTTIPYTIPDSVTTTSLGVIGNSNVTVNWSAPFNQGNAITAYYVTYYNGASLIGINTVSSGITSNIVTGLVNGTLYTFSVTAQNAAGNSIVVAASNVYATPYTVPAGVTNANVVAFNSAAQVNWSVPSFNGGNAITYYNIFYGLAGNAYGSSNLSTVTVNSTVFTNTINGLTNALSYVFYVVAQNIAGNSVYTTLTTIPYTIPDSVTTNSVVIGNSNVTVNWSAPSNKGNAITAYYVTYYNGASLIGVNTVASGTTSNTVTGLVNGTLYTFSVTAQNAAGNSVVVAASNVYATPYTVPSAPLTFSATPGTGSVALSWSAPSSNGGTAITYYNIFYGIGLSYSTSLTPNLVFGKEVTSYTVTGLTSGYTYNFFITAQNAAGNSVSNFVSATQYAVPSAPLSFTALATAQSASLSWSVPSSNGGTAITKYNIFYGIGLSYSNSLTPNIVVDSGVTTYYVTNLTVGSTYNFYITAQNAAGNSVSNSASVIPTELVTSLMYSAIDSKDFIYVTDISGGRVFKYDSSKNLITSSYITNLTYPNGICIDNNDNLYVCNSGVGKVAKYDSSGSLINASFITGLTSPSVCGFNINSIYVASKRYIYKYSISGKFVGVLETFIDSALSSTDTMTYLSLDGMAFSRGLYALSMTNIYTYIPLNRITLQKLTAFCSPYSYLPYAYVYANAYRIYWYDKSNNYDISNNLYTCNSYSNPCVIKKNGQPFINGTGSIIINSLNAVGMFSDNSNNLYVVDYQSAGGIYKLNTNNPSLYVNSPGTNTATAAVFDKYNNLYVNYSYSSSDGKSSSGKGAIIKYTPSQILDTTFSSSGIAYNPYSSTTSMLSGLVIDSKQNLYTICSSSTNNSYILKFSYNINTVLSSTNVCFTSSTKPTALYMDEDDTLFVADSTIYIMVYDANTFSYIACISNIYMNGYVSSPIPWSITMDKQKKTLSLIMSSNEVFVYYSNKTIWLDGYNNPGMGITMLTETDLNLSPDIFNGVQYSFSYYSYVANKGDNTVYKSFQRYPIGAPNNDYNSTYINGRITTYSPTFTPALNNPIGISFNSKNKTLYVVNNGSSNISSTTTL
jgi:hypothetical protein